MMGSGNMAKYQNVFKEASRRMKNFQSRGFIPAGSKYVFQDFVNEVSAENRGEHYSGAYTKNAYNEAYGSNIDYDSSETYEDIKNDREEELVKIYRRELNELYHTNDFYEMAMAYGTGRGNSFSPSRVTSIDTLEELIANASEAMNVEPYLFRNISGRNRSEESSMMETYQNRFVEELGHLIDEMSEQKMKFKY